MADIKWIKLSTALPDNRKIKQLRKLPDGDTIVLLWVFLMCLAGETNDDGLIYFTPEVAYTEEMLANQFDIDINTVRLGLKTFQQFGMAEIKDNIICLSHWEKWQAVDKMAIVREQTRSRVAKHREKQRLAACNVTGNVTVTQSNATEQEQEQEQEQEREREERIKNNNIIPGSTGQNTPKPTKQVKHKYGEYTNVLLTDDELDKLEKEYPDCQERIERLSAYVASTGKRYKSHYATIRNWARKDTAQGGINNAKAGERAAAEIQTGTWL